ncbi:putative protein ImpA [Burkholderia cenocepacia KC-01]|nr:putative protein ImpA [Burkholderia cenocepacia KC-01]
MSIPPCLLQQTGPLYRRIGRRPDASLNSIRSLRPGDFVTCPAPCRCRQVDRHPPVRLPRCFASALPRPRKSARPLEREPLKAPDCCPGISLQPVRCRCNQRPARTHRVPMRQWSDQPSPSWKPTTARPSRHPMRTCR